MWVTQTYLKSPEPEAKVHVYYLFQNYNHDEKERTQQIQHELERMGHRFGGDVSLLMPSEMSADRIESEVREIRPLWEAVAGQLPGVLVCTRPMSDFRFEDGQHFFVSLSDPVDVAVAADRLARISEIVGEQLEYRHRQISSVERAPSGRFRRFFEAVELKPGIAGFRVDLKKFLQIH